MPIAEKPVDLILRTKLYRPQLTPRLVNRARLIESMTRALEVPLTLVSAPAGYGKSILVSQWADQCDELIAWVSLEAGDSDLRTFLEYLLAALDTVSPGSCPAIRELLAGGALPPVNVVADYLVNELDDIDSPCFIVLDDYHRIDRASLIAELMSRVLEHLPQSIHFVIITRRDPPLPLAKLRADNCINDVRLQNLRFTQPETLSFLYSEAELAVSEEALANLEHEVEGWAVGLRLVALALRNAKDPESFLKGMHGGLPNAQEYLLQEVIRVLSPGTRGFLLASSVLDRFCADVLAAILDSTPGTAKPELTATEFVAELQRSNLFTIPLDVAGKWFRHHHLFQELLTKELRRTRGPEHIATLHTRASEWFESEDLTDEALKHALAAGDAERAADLVERNRESALNADNWYILERWLALLPETVARRRARLLLTEAWILVHHFRFEAAMTTLAQAESRLDDVADPEPLRGEVALLRGYILFFAGDGAGSLAQIEQALERIPVTFYEARAQSEVIFALSSQMEGHKEQAVRGLDELLLRYDSPDEVRKTRLLVTYVFLGIVSGELIEAESSNGHLREVAERRDYAYATAFVDYLQGLIHLHRCELTEAVEHLERSVARRFIHFKRAAVDSIAGLMLAYETLGRRDDAAKTEQLLRDYVVSLNDPELWGLVDSSAARLAIMQGRADHAASWAESSTLAEEGAMIWWLELPSITRCRALISKGTDASLVEAEELLRERMAVARAHHNTCHLIEVLTLLSTTSAKRGKEVEALALLEQAVTLARPGGFVFPFMEAGPPIAGLLGKLASSSDDTFVVQILSVLAEVEAARGETASDAPPLQDDVTRRVTAPEALDGLTNREMEVLELLAQRLQNKEIADRLGVSTHTVQDHLKRIYQKLDVHGRRQAVRRADELGMLGNVM